MEIILEILFVVLQLVGNLVLQIVVEVLIKFGLHSIGEPIRRPKPLPPWLAAIGYAALGVAAGAMSLWIFPQQFIATPWLRIVNLVITPIVAGAFMAAMGAWQRKKNEDLIRLDRFAYGFLFALAMAVVRITWGQ